MKNLSNFNFRRIFHVVAATVVAFAFFAACEELEDATSIELTADAGNDLNVNAGNLVTLDGSNSSASQGDFSFFWSFAAMPSGSSAQLTDVATANPNFTPDVAGEYWVLLTITNGAQEDQDTVKVFASGSGNITADAGSDQQATVNGTVNLDGSGSSAQSGTLAYTWSFASVPNGSSASISNANSVNASFTPDVAGDYVITLSVTNGTSTATDQLTVTVTGAATIELSGSIDTDMTLSDNVEDPNTPDYLVTGNLGINANLIIEPGVLVHVNENAGIWINNNGTIQSNGESGNEVVITSAGEADDLHWKGILVYSSSSENILQYTKVLYAGNSDFNHSGTNYSHAVGIEGGKLSMVQSEISNSKTLGFFLHSGELNDFSSNVFSDNADYSIRINANEAGKLDNATTFSNPDMAVNIYGSTLASTEEIVWPDLNSNARYFVSGWIYVDSYLKITPGAIFDFAEDKAIKVRSEGVFVADASESDQIIFTSKKASTDVYWKGIWVLSSDARNILANVQISHAGNSEWNFSGWDYASALAIETGKLNIANTTIDNSASYGVYLKSGSLTGFSSNTFENNSQDAMVMMMEEVGKIDAATTFTNNGWDGITIYSSTMTSDATWPNLKDDAMYKATGKLYAEAGLTLNPGVEIAFDENISLAVQSSGYISAQGTSSDQIVFTTSNEAGQIPWQGIWIKTSDARNELDYVVVNYAGSEEFNFSGWDYAAAIAGDDDDNPRVSITNSTVKNSQGYAIYWEGGTINAVESSSANNTFDNNADGVYTP